MIKVKNLVKNYGDFKALDNISFEVKRGEIVGFLGPNGAGKTTTMRVLTGFLAKTEGKTEIDGLDIDKYPIEIKRRIGYLPENAPLYHDMTVEEYLFFAGQMHDIKTNMLEERIRKTAVSCGLKGKFRQNIGELSKGYRQRAILAQALLHNPEILILDEPTVGLDPNQIIEIRNLIKHIGEKKTVILSTHIMQEVEAVCDRVLIINKGRIVAKGTKNEIKDLAQESVKIYIKIEGPFKSVISKLKNIKDVISVKKTDSESEDVYGYEINTSKNSDLRKTLVKFVSQNKWDLLEITRNTVSLEDVFRKLTK